jgi:energy-coupling factor transport system permease protein
MLKRPHPVVRILALVILGAGLFQFSLTALIIVFATLLGLTAARGQQALRGLHKALRRIRWLLLSIVIIYLWVAPQPDSAGGLIPATGDIVLALKRAGILAVLVTAVELLRQTTPAGYTAAAVALLISPLRIVGIDTTRFATRMALTLEAVPATSEVVIKAAGETTIKKLSLTGWAEAAARLIQDIETRGDDSTSTVRLPALATPTALDWLILLAVALATFSLTRI